jgi:uncharacterized protein
MDKMAYLGALMYYGGDILRSPTVKSQADFIQHGGVSILNHTVRVACLSLKIAQKLNILVDLRSLVRGALLHDYFLYDWHEHDKSHKLHGFRHARRAFENASRDFELNDVEKNIILRHMYPLTLVPPRYVESIIVSISDKLCALQEIFFMRKLSSKR